MSAQYYTTLILCVYLLFFNHSMFQSVAIPLRVARMYVILVIIREI